MSLAKAAAVMKDLWKYCDTSPEAIIRKVNTARATLANPTSTAGHLEVARRIVAAADEPDGAAPATATPTATPAPAAPMPPAAPAPEAILGLAADGAELTVSACRAAGVDPLVYLTREGVTLTAAGRDVLQNLRELVAADPALHARQRARELGIDVGVVTAAAKAQGIDPEKAIAAEVEMLECARRDGTNVLCGAGRIGW